MGILKIIFIGIFGALLVYVGYLLFTNLQKSGQPGAYDRTVCWNFAYVYDDGLGAYWKDGCGGMKPRKDIACTMALAKMSDEEFEGWKKWEAAGKPDIEGCSN
jgi:hypothetical protein